MTIKYSLFTSKKLFICSVNILLHYRLSRWLLLLRRTLPLLVYLRLRTYFIIAIHAFIWAEAIFFGSMVCYSRCMLLLLSFLRSEIVLGSVPLVVVLFSFVGTGCGFLLWLGESYWFFYHLDVVEKILFSFVRCGAFVIFGDIRILLKHLLMVEKVAFRLFHW